MRRYFPDIAINVWPHPEVAPGAAAAHRARRRPGQPFAGKGPACGRRLRARRARARAAAGVPPAGVDDRADAAVAGRAADDLWTIRGRRAAAPHRAPRSPTCSCFAAQVPETYAYTLSVALDSGLPIVASALGAFTERLAGQPRSATVPWNAPPSVWNERAARGGRVARRRSGSGVARSRSRRRPDGSRRATSRSTWRRCLSAPRDAQPAGRLCRRSTSATSISRRARSKRRRCRCRSSIPPAWNAATRRRASNSSAAWPSSTSSSRNFARSATARKATASTWRPSCLSAQRVLLTMQMHTGHVETSLAAARAPHRRARAVDDAGA